MIAERPTDATAVSGFVDESAIMVAWEATPRWPPVSVTCHHGRVRMVVACVALLLLVTGCGSAAPTTVAPEAVAFSGTTLDGAAFDGSALGGSPVVLWFWAPY